MRRGSVWKKLLGLQRAVVEDVELTDTGALVVSVRSIARERDRCPHCRRRCPGYDLGDGRRRWRALDVGTTFAYLEAAAPRVNCRRHDVVVAAVPWARHDSRFTRSFEDQVAWLACRCSKTAVSELMRVAWRSVRGILERVADEARRNVDLLDGLKRIGIDEISHRKGQRYLTIVVDHHTGRLVWAAAGRDRKTVLAFFDALGEERCKQIELVSCDMASWIAGPVAERCPGAVRCVHPFHVIQLATDALDAVRREVWNEARRQGNMELARDLKGARFAVWKNPEVRHEAPSLPGGDERTPPLAHRSGLVEAEGSLTAETRGRVGAALTTTGRVGTARRPGSGKRDEKVYERNQRQSPVSLPPAQTWWMRAGLQCTLPFGSDSALGSSGSRRRPWGRSAAYVWRCCRGIVGRLTRQPGGGERGNRHGSPSCLAIQAGSGQVRRRLSIRVRGGGSVVVRERESRSHGEGTQQVRSLGVGRPGGRP